MLYLENYIECNDFVFLGVFYIKLIETHSEDET